ncbi:MAG: hypothetical protein KR126chlam1_00165 [Chlamydiae bacterium]|nr:hypothetical protein [Chlamydiota bacterium]
MIEQSNLHYLKFPPLLKSDNSYKDISFLTGYAVYKIPPAN